LTFDPKPYQKTSYVENHQRFQSLQHSSHQEQTFGVGFQEVGLLQRVQLGLLMQLKLHLAKDSDQLPVELACKAREEAVVAAQVREEEEQLLLVLVARASTPVLFLARFPILATPKCYRLR
jgi:hypothetical protein